ncbi:MAG: RNA polymerase sigma factor [Candidatus Limnocylindrales bacterium]
MVESVWSEQELIRRCKEGSEAAYAELVRQHRQRLLNLAYRLTSSRETAEDVVQETFLAAFRAMERFEPNPALAPWLTTICVRLAGRAAGKQSSARVASLDQLTETDSPPALSALFAAADGHAADPHAAAETAELRRALTSAIAALPYKQRAAVVLRFVTGLDYADAAQAMDVPLNTYKSHLLRGTRQLRDVLLPLLSGPGGEPTGPTDTTDAGGTGRSDGGRPADRSIGQAIPVVDRIPVVDGIPVLDELPTAAPDGTRPARAVPVRAAARQPTRSARLADDSTP